jgi:hypothetical protein
MTGLKRFLSRRQPALDRILFVESGARETAERWLAWLAKERPRAKVDLLTCYEGRPANFDRIGCAVFSTHDYPTPESRERLIEEFRANRYDAVAILATAEPIMTKWKWWVVWKVHAKAVLVNENADWFWLDRAHWSVIRRFAAYRAGLSGTGAILQPLRLLAFPFTLSYLLLFATFVHARRRLLS